MIIESEVTIKFCPDVGMLHELFSSIYCNYDKGIHVYFVNETKTLFFYQNPMGADELDDYMLRFSDVYKLNQLPRDFQQKYIDGERKREFLDFSAYSIKYESNNKTLKFVIPIHNLTVIRG